MGREVTNNDGFRYSYKRGLLEECESRSITVHVTSGRYVVLDKSRLFFGNVTIKKSVTFYVLCIPLEATECCQAHV